MFVGLVAVASCTDAMLDPDPPGTIKPTGELTIIRLPADAPPLFNDSVAFYARPGRDAEGFIYFQEDDGSRGEKFVELKIKQGSLAAFPDGRPFGPNDSVRIVIRVRDARTLIVDLEPAGLSFNRAEPAELKIEYEETGGDLDDDGDDDEDDDEIEQLIAIWRQENPTDPFVKLGTVKTEGLRELEAELLGFSRFAVAY
jgi:hypothetical protein